MALTGVVTWLLFAADARSQVGSIAGTVYDLEFGNSLDGVRVEILDTGQQVRTNEKGDFRLDDVDPGSYTLTFSRVGYVSRLANGVGVLAGRLTEVDMSLPGDYSDMDVLVVQDLLAGVGGAGEMELLELRFDSPALIDSISSDLMSRAGAGDAASALNLVSGATVQGGKFAVIRGLPDRYVSSQMNGVRLPSADEDTRAVELDQFPAAVIDNIQVTKTFTPNQQGDASGGAVDVILKGVPAEMSTQWKTEYSYNDRGSGGHDFLTYHGGPRRIQYENLGGNWDGGVGIQETSNPNDFKFSGSTGGRIEVDRDVVVGGFVSAFYEKDSSHITNGVDDQRWIESGSNALVPEKKQQQGNDDFATALFDVTRSTRTESYGTLATVGMEAENASVGLTYLYTKVIDDKASLVTDTRGKKIFTQQFFGVEYDVNDPNNPGNDAADLAPYRRSETLEYTERTTSTLQLHSELILPADIAPWGAAFDFGPPELQWSLAHSSASLDQPDKRLLGTKWLAPDFKPGIPFLGIPDSVSEPSHQPFKPAANANLGYLQRIFKDITEESDQLSVDLSLPFEQWDEEEGAFHAGLFHDTTEREFNQDTFSNPGEFATYEAGFHDLWSSVFPFENHPLTAADTDVDYRAEQQLDAVYAMFDLPLHPDVRLLGGVRLEDRELSVRSTAEADATFYSQADTDGDGLPDSFNPVDLNGASPEAAAARNFSKDDDDVLPSLGIDYTATDEVTIRAAYSETVARQTFKELTPILQQEFLGGPLFIGNPELEQSDITNYDLRVDWRPADDTLVSASWFYKEVRDAIETVQRGVGNVSFTTVVNYPEGRLQGYELELRQGLGRFWDGAEGISVGANGTIIDSEVEIDPIERFIVNFQTGKTLEDREMTGAPEHLYNLYTLYDLPEHGTSFSLFYTVKGDTLVAGAGANKGNYVPNVFQKEVGTLNFAVSQLLGRDDQWTVTFKARNLLDPRIDEVYRGPFVDGEVIRTSYRRGREYSLSLSGRF